MAVHSLEPTRENLHGHFSRDLAPVLRIESGDTVRFRTLDANWGNFKQEDPFATPTKFEPRNLPEDKGHCIVGPVYIEDLNPGDTLEVRINKVRTGTWGWSSAGGFPSFVNEKLNLVEGDSFLWRWKLDPDTRIAENQYGRTLPMRPFMGLIGMPADEEGIQSTVPPRSCGGNIDCKELIEGTTLYLPVAVRGGLFSLGDGHARQGDGEVANPAIECPMESVEVELIARPDIKLRNPRAETSVGWVTLGFHEDLNEAMIIALDGMLDLLGELAGMHRKEALGFCSLCVDLRISQVVNGVKGVHAVLPPGLL